MFKWLKKLIVGATMRIFRFASSPLSLKWTFRIRYLTSICNWVIELDEGGMESWNVLTHRVAAANNALVEKPFASYYEARQYVSDLGIDVAYKEVFANSDRPELATFKPHPMVLKTESLELPEVTGPAPLEHEESHSHIVRMQDRLEHRGPR